MMRHMVLLFAIAGCGLPDRSPVPTDSFAFAVFGDGPYYPWESGRFTRLVADVNDHDLAFFIHVGDILERPCSDEAFVERRDLFNTIQHPVIYTPGDNEWTDCHRRRAGRYEPLDRLASLRRVFFADPHRSLGAVPMALESQVDDAGFHGFPENARWERGGFVFVTVHMVGSNNGSVAFATRTAAHDDEVRARTAAARAWMDSAFARATVKGLRGVVIAFHGEPGLEAGEDRQLGFDPFVAALEHHAAVFDGEVLVIHGDWHDLKIDHPFRHPATGDTLRNITRLETYGSPDIGWIRVVVDTVAGRFVAIEPRPMPRRWLLF